MPKFEEMQVKAKALIEEALSILKVGVSEAEFIAGKTANAAKLHMKSKQSRIEKYRLLHELGEIVYGTAGSGNSVEVTKRMRDIISQAAKLDEVIVNAEKKISGLTVTTKIPAARAKKTPESKAKHHQ